MSWRGVEPGLKAAKQGHDVIMTPSSHVYFDHYQAKETKHEPDAIGGCSPVEKVYSYEPLPETLDAEAKTASRVCKLTSGLSTFLSPHKPNTWCCHVWPHWLRCNGRLPDRKISTTLASAHCA